MKAVDFPRGLFVVLVVFLSIACTKKEVSVSSSTADPEVAAGRKLVSEKTCTTCHSVNGQPGVGPTFMYLFGRNEKLADGSEVLVDEAYLRESIVNPHAKVVARYAPNMPVIPLSEKELDQIVAFIRSLAKPSP